MKHTSKSKEKEYKNDACIALPILSELTPSALIVFQFFLKRRHLDAIYHSHGHIAKQTHLNISTIKRSLVLLKKKKLIEWEYRHRKTNIYKISANFDNQNSTPPPDLSDLPPLSGSNERPGFNLFSYLLTQLTIKVKGSAVARKISSFFTKKKKNGREANGNGQSRYQIEGKEYIFRSNGIPLVIGGESIVLDEYGNYIPASPPARKKVGLPENHKRARMNVIEDISRHLFLTDLGKQVLLQFNSLVLSEAFRRYPVDILKSKINPVLYLVGVCESISKEKNIVPYRRDYLEFVRKNPDNKEFMNWDLFYKARINEEKSAPSKSRAWIPEPPRQDIPENLSFLESAPLEGGALFFRDILLGKVRVA